MRRNKEESKQYWFAIKQLVSREIKRRYARSYLGVVWSVLNPLLSMAIISMIFSKIFQKSIANFPIYLLTANILWNLFTGITNSAMTTLVDNHSLLLKVKLPKQTFVLARMFTSLTNFGYSCIAYALMIVIFRVKPTFYMPLFLVDVFFICLFSLGIGYLLSILYTFFGDIKHLYSVFLTLLHYLCAIFYPVDVLPEGMQKIVNMNPVYNYILFARKVMLFGEMPEPIVWVKVILWGVGCFTVGYLVFKWKENSVMIKL